MISYLFGKQIKPIYLIRIKGLPIVRVLYLEYPIYSLMEFPLVIHLKHFNLKADGAEVKVMGK